MKVNVTATRCIVENDVELNAGEYNINKFYFTFSPEYLDNYVKKALFVAKDKPPIEMVIANDECNIPYDILKKPGVYMVGVYAYEIDENNELILRYSPEPTHFYVNRGSYIENAETPTEPDPDEFAQYYQAMQDLIATAKPEFKEYIDENLPTVEVGEVETLPPGSQVIITNSGTDRHPILNFGIPEGKKGDTIDQIEIESDEENYQFKIKIYDNDGKLISESNMVDLPIEIFVKNTDYATENVGGVIKSSSNSGFVVDKNTGKVTGVNTSYSDLSNKDDKYLISKGTLDKYVTGKRLVSRTDYADSTTAGVIKVGTNADVDSNGYLKGNVLTYNQYLERNAENFISKGTLENLLRTRNYLKSSDAESTYSTIAETGKTIELDINNSTYAMTITLKDKNGNTLSSDTIDLPLETMVIDAYYDKYSKEIVLTLQSGTSTRFSVADLVSGLQSEITANNKLKSDLVDDTNQVHKFVTSEEKTTWNNKVDSSVTRSSHSGNYNGIINNNGNMVMIGSSYKSDGNVENSVLVLGSSGFSIVSDNKNIIGTDQNKNLFLKNVITPTDDTDAVNKKYVDDTIDANSIDVQVNNTSIVSNNVADISVTGSYNETDSPLLSLWDVAIDDSVPLGADENSIAIHTTSGNYDGSSVLLVTNDTLESEYVPIAADAAMQGTNYSSSINNVGYQIDFSIMNNTSGDSNSILLTPTETYIGNVRDPENDGDAVNKKYVDDIVISASPTDVQINGKSIVSSNVANILTEGVYGTRNKLLTKDYADTHYVLEERIDDNVGYMYILPSIKDDKDVDFLINAQSNLDSEAYADLNFGVEYDENEGRGNGYFRLALYDAGSIEIDNNGTKITKIITPTNDGDAVNKKYVDDAVSDIDLSGKTDATKTLAGYTSQVRNNGANIVLSNVSTSDNTKSSGVLFTNGNFAFSKNNVELISSNDDGKLRLYNVKDPTNDGDAVNKKYVDDAVSDIDLSDYVKNTDYATSSVGGVIKTSSSYGSSVASNGTLQGSVRQYSSYSSDNDKLIICKGTLENVITGKDLTTKAYVDGLVGDISSVIDAINGEVV